MTQVCYRFYHPVFLAMIFVASTAFTHKKIRHRSASKDQVKVSKHHTEEQIRVAYLRSIKTIFQRSCIDCHSSKTVYPWYAKLPVISYFMAADIEAAQKHIDFGQDFPFKSRVTPGQDLEEISKVMQDNSMPPWMYRLLHPEAILSSPEKKDILAWANMGASLEK